MGLLCFPVWQPKINPIINGLIILINTYNVFLFVFFSKCMHFFLFRRKCILYLSHLNLIWATKTDQKSACPNGYQRFWNFASWKNITENILSGCFLFYCLWVNHIQTQHYNTAVKVSGDIISQVTTEKCISHDKKKASSKTGYSETEDQHVLRRHLEIRSCCVTDLNITRHTHKCDTPLIHSFIYFANTHS